MAIAFLTNGLGAFGLRILAGSGLGGIKETQYLSMWYAAGLLLALAAYPRRHGRPAVREAIIGGGMAVCSLCGQLGMALALSAGIPGFVVFPIATGGALFLVVLVGVLAFRELLSGLGLVGIATGVIAMVLLALPG